MARRRLDAEMVHRGLVDDIESARHAIEQQLVVISGAPAFKPDTLVAPEQELRLVHGARFVSRGGDKLDGALEELALDVDGRRCIDIGAGSGGFTDCLLQRGAEHVVAVDVGFGQFDWRLRSDPRVTLKERTNFRTAEVESLEGPVDLVVADLSFIGLKGLIGKIVAISKERADWVLLVKPQFEAPRSDVGDGVVTDPAVWQSSIDSVSEAIVASGWRVSQVVASRLKGAQGNQEFFVHAVRATEARP